MNLRQEFEETVGDRVVRCAIVHFKVLHHEHYESVRVTARLPISYTPEQYQRFVEFFELFVQQPIDRVEGTIWFVDGSWADRVTEDAVNGSWWEVRELPAIPMELGEELKEKPAPIKSESEQAQEAKRFDLRLSSKILVQGLTVLKLYENPVQAIEEGLSLEKTHRGGLEHTPKFYLIYESIPFSKYGKDVATSIALRGEEISIEQLKQLAAEWSEPGPEPETSEEPETFI